MKPLTITCFCFLLAIAACNDTATEETPAPKADSPAATTAAAPTPPAPVDTATYNRNWQEYMTPGEAHKMLAKSNGNWNAEVSMWQTPGGEPTKGPAKAVHKMIFNGLYQQSNFTGNVMGMPFQGQSTLGFDNHKKLFVSSWVDNMGTGIMYMEGPWDEATKTMTLTGKMMEPGTKQMTDHKQTLKMVDDNTQIMEMFGPGPDGNSFKMMEIKYTRAK